MLAAALKENLHWLALPDGDFYRGVHAYLMCLGLLNQGSGEGLLTNPVRFNFLYKLSLRMPHVWKIL